MKFSIAVFIFSLILCNSVNSCSSGKSGISDTGKNSVQNSKAVSAPMTYRFHFGASGTATKPHEEFWIDSTGKMTFDTRQHMKNGTWKTPRGLSYIEPRDEDTLLYYIKQDALFDIDESDVSPQCPEGESFALRIARSDLKKELAIITNTCASEFNLLTGQQRKIFPPFLAFLNRLRDRYRPLFTD
ncbi:MAG: hypothetical protein Q8916_02010 [Bacteroidota bacterium]|nr:hypothetical protein [Bacteroidota bacterium]MDP4229162.1 hypothetical protein [Bacteroidota bacterium]MDP4236343.1 hypothetical protein [Bacteroidota bacterium]